MGQFIDTQQGLLSEAKQKRLEREQAKADKERREGQELELFFSLDNMLYNTRENTKEKQYNELKKPKARDFIIEKIVDNDNLKDIYILTKKYDTILSNVYKAYKQENDKELLKKYELKLFRTLKNTIDFMQYHAKEKSYYFSSYMEAYEFLKQATVKDRIILNITTEAEGIYFLNKKYMTILNNLYKPYKTKTTKQTKTETVKQEQVKQTKKTGTGILIFSTIMAIIIEILKVGIVIFLAPVVFLVSFFIHKK